VHRCRVLAGSRPSPLAPPSHTFLPPGVSASCTSHPGSSRPTHLVCSPATLRNACWLVGCRSGGAGCIVCTRWGVGGSAFGLCTGGLVSAKLPSVASFQRFLLDMGHPGAGLAVGWSNPVGCVAHTAAQRGCFGMVQHCACLLAGGWAALLVFSARTGAGGRLVWQANLSSRHLAGHRSALVSPSLPRRQVFVLRRLHCLPCARLLLHAPRLVVGPGWQLCSGEQAAARARRLQKFIPPTVTGLLVAFGWSKPGWSLRPHATLKLLACAPQCLVRPHAACLPGGGWLGSVAGPCAQVNKPAMDGSTVVSGPASSGCASLEVGWKAAPRFAEGAISGAVQCVCGAWRGASLLCLLVSRGCGVVGSLPWAFCRRRSWLVRPPRPACDGASTRGRFHSDDTSFFQGALPPV